jgi:TRAP-type mannitol/chloroaromatic compound transport system substrate-binding protein
MPAHHKAILKVGMQALGLKNSTINEVKNAETAKMLRDKGVKLNTWSDEDMAVYRTAVQEAWTEFATTPESKSLLESHLSFLRELGAMK